jgi:hypothetical protein
MVATIHPFPFHLSTKSRPTVPPRPREPRAGELCYGVAIWRAAARAKWSPRFPCSRPPMFGGWFTIILFTSFDMVEVLADVRDHNTSALEYAAKRGRVKTWAVPVQLVCGHEETAATIELVALVRKGGEV